MTTSTDHVTSSAAHMITTDLTRSLLNGQYGECAASDVTGAMETDGLHQTRDTAAGENLNQLVG